MATPPNFRLFVSSTFADFERERNELQRTVFPHLSDLCAERGARFQAIDLRWGVSREATQQHDTMRICLEEIDRCRAVTARPNLLILMGERYGWQPLPYAIPSQEFEQIRPNFTSAQLADQYEEDRNSVPPVYLLKPNTERSCERDFHQELRQAAEAAQLPREALRKYQASATEQEIWRACLDVDVQPGQVLCCMRRVRDASGGPTSAEQQRLRERVRARLGDDVYEYEGDEAEDIRTFCAEVEGRLAKTIRAELDSRGLADPEQQEIDAHRDFADRRARHFHGRQALLGRIHDYLRNESTAPLTIVGPAGCGKSAVVGRALGDAAIPGVVVVTRFLGATPDSSNGVRLLTSLAREIEGAYGSAGPRVSASYDDALERFQSAIRHAHRERPLTLLLDGLDQISGGDPARDFAWIEGRLPPYVKLVVSCTEEMAANLPGASRVAVEPMSAEDGGALLRAWLTAAGRTLTREQEESVNGRFAQCPLPLYLRLAFEQARRWRSWEPPHALQPDAPGIVRDLFRSLERAHGAVLVSHALGYLSAARNGLSEDEFIGLLSADREVVEEIRRRSPESPPVEGLPTVIWSRLRLDVDAHLGERTADGAAMLAYYDRLAGEVAREDYLAPPEAVRRHAHLARYFEEQSARHRDLPLRALSELPFQQAGAKMQSEFSRTLTSYRFLRAKLRAFGPDALIRDYGLASSFTGAALEGLHDVQQMLTVASATLARSPGQLPAQLLARLMDRERDEHRELLAQASLEREAGWWRPITASLESRGDTPVRTLRRHTDNVNALAFIAASKRLVSAASDGALLIWDLEHWSEPRKIAAHDRPVRALAVTPDGRRAISASEDHSLKIWDLHSGTLRHELKGHKGPVVAVTTVDDRVCVSGSDDKTLGVWRIDDGELERTIPAHGAAVRGVAAIGKEDLVLSCSDDGCLRVWSWRTGERKYSIERAHAGPIIGVSVSQDGRRAATASEDRSIGIWELDGMRMSNRLQGHFDAVALAIFTPDGEIVSASFDGRVKLWEGSGALEETFTGHTGWVTALAAAPEMGLVFSGGDDRKINAWRLHPPKPPGTLVAADGSGRFAATANGISAARIWDLERGAEVRRLHGAGRDVSSLTLSEDGARLCCGYGDGSVRSWEVSTGREAAESGAVVSSVDTDSNTRALITQIFEQPGITKVASAGGSMLVSLNSQGSVQFRRRETGQVVQTISFVPDPGSYGLKQGGPAKYQLPGRPVTDVSGLGNREGAVLACRDGALWIADGRSRAVPINIHTSPITSVVLLPGTGRVLSAGNDGGIRVWEAADGRLTLSFQLDRQVTSVAAMPGEGRIVVAGGGGRLRVYDLETRRLLKEFSPHIETVTYVAAIDDTRVLSASQEGMLRVWNIESDTDVASFGCPADSCAVVAVSASAQIAIAGGLALTAWDFGAGRLLWSIGGIGRVSGLAFMPGSRTAVAVCADDVLHEYDARSGQRLRSQPLPPGTAGPIQITADGHAVIAGGDNTLRLIDPGNGVEIAAFTADHRMGAFTYQENGAAAVAGDESGRLHFLQLRGV